MFGTSSARFAATSRNPVPTVCGRGSNAASCLRSRREREKKKLHERELIEQLQKYEALMTKHGVSFEPVLEGDGADLDADLESTASPRDGK